ncbi:TPA: glycosyltransferase family 4 protein [Serratia fonticola]
MNRIGYIQNKYPEQRCIINKTKNNYVNLSRFNFSRYAYYIDKLRGADFSNFQFIFIGIVPSSVKMMHFFNFITPQKKNWVTTFETSLPRCRELISIHHNPDYVDGIKRCTAVEKKLKWIASEHCKAIIALSQSAKKIQKNILNVYSEYKDTIENKIHVVAPPQKILISNNSKKKLNETDEIRVLFVGGDFYRKGGAETVIALNNIVRKNNIKLSLTVIGDLARKNNYVLKEWKDDEGFYKKVSEIIEKEPWIVHHQSLSNYEVLNLMQQSHVGLLPTWSDTYGYSVLEMQASGCPVITTNVRALTEINNEHCGWVIKLPLNKYSELAIDSQEKKDSFRNTIISGIENAILELNSKRGLIQVKSTNSLDRIIAQHDPEDYKSKLEKIYDKCS